MRRIARKFANIIARARFASDPRLVIHNSAHVNLYDLTIKRDCSLSVGANSLIEGSLIFECPRAAITIGARTYIGASQLICAESISIGNDVLISWGCTIVDHNSHALSWQLRKNDVAEWRAGRKDWTHVDHSAVHIGDRVWIGFNAILLKGVDIGIGAIVGAGSVVTKSVPPYTVVGGNPARVIRQLEHE